MLAIQLYKVSIDHADITSKDQSLKAQICKWAWVCAEGTKQEVCLSKPRLKFQCSRYDEYKLDGHFSYSSRKMVGIHNNHIGKAFLMSANNEFLPEIRKTAILFW